MTETRVAIVGAGITGLALARELRRRGVDPLVLEAADRPGGVIHTVEVEGKVLEAGPQRTRLVPGVARLVDELELRDRVVTGDPDLPLYVYRDGRLRRVPFSPGGWLTTDLFSVRGKLRMLLEPFLPSARAEADPRESVASFVTRKLGREAYLYLVAPLYGGIYGSDPGDMLVEYTLGKALEQVGFGGRSLVLAAARWMIGGDEPPPPATFTDGMGELVDALHRRARDRVRLSCRVTEAVREEAGEGGGPRWRLRTEDGGEVRAPDVVLTCPADEAAGILAGEAEGAARRLSRLHYNPLAIVHLHGDCDLEGFGYQTALPEASATRGVTWNASLFDRDGVYTAYLGGALRPDVLERSDPELGELARREFRRVTGCDARVLRVGRTRMPAWDRSWTALEGLELPGGIHLCANYVDRAGIPGRLRAARAAAEELAPGEAPAVAEPAPGRGAPGPAAAGEA